jgi:hypothetical protein
VSEGAGRNSTWPYLRIGLLVTGETEEKHAHLLFRSLAATGTCSFKVIRRVEQSRPRTSPRRLKVTGTDKAVTTRREDEISLPTRRYLREDVDHFVVLLDDIEHEHRSKVQEVYEMYRKALDHALKEDERGRASIHFLVNMLEAYYFGDPDAVNDVLGPDPPVVAGNEDVEEIRNPKADIRRLFPGFGEIEHGGRILARLNVGLVLSNPSTCAWLRTLFGWCVKVLDRHPHWREAGLTGDAFHLNDGIMSYVTGPQLGER